MAVVQPLIRYPDSGKVEELRVGDTLPGASGAQRTFAFFAG